nr:NADH dehydrogenase subunit 2 [Lernaea cyprinacea]
MILYWKSNPYAFMMFMSIMSAASANNLFSIWFFMELSTLSFLGVMISEISQELSTLVKRDTLIIYFIIQTLPGLLILFLILNPMNFWTKFFIVMLLMVKLGSAPFHQWMYSLSISMNWKILWVMSTIQKFPPLFMLLISSSPCLIMFACINMVVGTLLSMNCLNFKMIMAGSSLIQMGWVMLILNSHSNEALIFFMLYTILSGLIMYMLAEKHQEKFKIETKNKMYSTMLYISMLMLMSFPPTWMFFIKMSIMQDFTTISPLFILFFFLITSIFSYNYVKIFFASTTSQTPETIISIHTNEMNYMSILSLVIIIPLMVVYLI